MRVVSPSNQSSCMDLVLDKYDESVPVRDSLKSQTSLIPIISITQTHTHTHTNTHTLYKLKCWNRETDSTSWVHD